MFNYLDHSVFEIPTHQASGDSLFADQMLNRTTAASKNSPNNTANYADIYKELNAISEEVMKCRNASLDGLI